MPVGATIRAAMRDDSGRSPTRQRSGWIRVHDNAKNAQSATELLNPYAINDADFHWCEVPQGANRFYIRARIDDGEAAVSVSPLVRPFGLDADPNDSTSTAATTNALRLDTTSWTAGGFALSFNTAPTSSNMHTDGTDFITPLMPSTLDAFLSGYPVAGCRFIGVAVQSAGASTNAGTAIRVEIMFLT